MTRDNCPEKAEDVIIENYQVQNAVTAQSGWSSKAPCEAKGPWRFRKIEGWVPLDPSNPNNGQREKVLVVWRTLTGDPEKTTWFSTPGSKKTGPAPATSRSGGVWKTDH